MPGFWVGGFGSPISSDNRRVGVVVRHSMKALATSGGSSIGFSGHWPNSGAPTTQSDEDPLLKHS
jgi:hypothetical protein